MANQKAKPMGTGNEGQTDNAAGRGSRTQANLPMSARRVNRVGASAKVPNSNHPDDNKRTIKDGRFTG